MMIAGASHDGGYQREIAVREAIELGGPHDISHVFVPVHDVEAAADVEHTSGEVDCLCDVRRGTRLERATERGSDAAAAGRGLRVPSVESRDERRQRRLLHAVKRPHDY